METLHREKLRGMNEADQVSDYKKGFEDAERFVSERYEIKLTELDRQMAIRARWISSARTQIDLIKQKKAQGQDYTQNVQALIIMHEYMEHLDKEN